MTFSVSKHGMLDMSKGKISLMSKKLGLKKLMQVEFSLPYSCTQTHYPAITYETKKNVYCKEIEL